jgi:negative regulator of flagellin synthesis FlgM
MKINLSNSTPDPVVNPRGNNTSPSSADQVHNTGEDTASLSFDRASVSSLVSQAMASPEVRQDKVDALRQAISNGQFKVEPARVAEAMLPEPPKS